MNYNNFRFRAVVDWIEVEIHTANPTHYDAIRRHAELSYVEPMNAGEAGKTATAFRFRIHDPANWSEVVRVVRFVSEKYALARPFEVVGIEVAFDAYGRKKVTREELAALVANFVRFSTHTSPNRRMYREEGEDAFAPPSNDCALVRKLAEEWQVGVGDKESDCYQHAYVKTTDNNKSRLPEGEHRARIEITLRGSKLPCNTLEKWSRCNFASLAKPYFNFRTLRTDLTPIEQVTASANTHIGKRGVRNRSEGGTRLFSRFTRADSTLNALARDRLRDLSARWSAGLACGNSGDAKPETPSNDAKPHENSNNYTSSNDDDLLLHDLKHYSTPELEAEQERINKLMDFDSPG